MNLVYKDIWHKLHLDTRLHIHSSIKTQSINKIKECRFSANDVKTVTQTTDIMDWNTHTQRTTVKKDQNEPHTDNKTSWETCKQNQNAKHTKSPEMKGNMKK